MSAFRHVPNVRFRRSSEEIPPLLASGGLGWETAVRVNQMSWPWSSAIAQSVERASHHQ